MTNNNISEGNAEVILLLEQWLAEDSEYDEETWGELKDKLVRSKTCQEN